MLICAEVYNEKLNLEFPFESRPTIPDLIDTIERVFRFESSQFYHRYYQQGSSSSAAGSSQARASSAPVEPIFSVLQAQVYVDEVRQWADLNNASQLHMYDQLYVIRKFVAPSDGGNGRRELPRPRPTLYFTQTGSGGGAASQQRESTPLDQSHSMMVVPASAPPTARGIALPAPSQARRVVEVPDVTPLSSRPPYVSSARPPPLVDVNLLDATEVPVHDMARTVFEVCDRRRHGVIDQNDLLQLLKRVAITSISRETVQNFFEVYATSGTSAGAPDSVMSFRDFCVFTSNYAMFLKTCFDRLVSLEKEVILRDSAQQVAMEINSMQEEKRALEEKIQKLHASMLYQKERATSLEEELHETLQVRQEDAPEEQALLDQEVRVQHQRYLLRKEEEGLAQLAMSTKRRSFSSQSSVVDAVGPSYGGGPSGYQALNGTPRSSRMFSR